MKCHTFEVVSSLSGQVFKQRLEMIHMKSLIEVMKRDKKYTVITPSNMCSIKSKCKI